MDDPSRSALPPGLAQRLRSATRDGHADAERAGIMRLLLKGELPLPRYRELLANLLAIYAALEPALAAHRDHACLAPLWHPSLARSASLELDLAALAGPHDVPPRTLQPAALGYVQRLQQLAAEDPPLLVAHAYVRYLGDLSGGQLLSRIVAGAYGLVDGRGTRFYDFGPAGQPAALAGALRRALDALPVDGALAAAIIDEAREAFGRHQALFVQLDD